MRADGPIQTLALAAFAWLVVAAAPPTAAQAGRAGAAPPPPSSGRVIDAIAVVVNGRVITAEQVREAEAFSAAASSGPGRREAPASASGRATLEHLITEELLEQERRRAGAPLAQSDVVAARFRAWEERAGGAGRLRARLAADGLSEARARDILARQITLWNFLSARLNATVAAPSAASVHDYYERTYLPAAAARGVAPAPPERAAPAIRAILRQQALLACQKAWIAQLRARAVINYRPPYSPLAASARPEGSRD